MNKKTLVLGATPNPSRYAYLAVSRLIGKDHEVIPVGFREGDIGGVKIMTGQPNVDNVHTISMYLSAKNQEQYIDYILGLKPERIIFNPGAENPDLKEKAEKENIEVTEDCTLVMLALNSY